MGSTSAGYTVLAAIAAAFLGGFFTWLTQRSKGKVEETVAVRGEWAKLTDGLSQRLAHVEEKFAAFQISSAEEIAQMKKDHAAEIAEMKKEHAAQIAAIKLNHAAEMKAMRDLNEGLQRMISNVSNSTAMMVGDVANRNHHGVEVAKAYNEARKRRDDDA